LQSQDWLALQKYQCSQRAVVPYKPDLPYGQFKRALILPEHACREGANHAARTVFHGIKQAGDILLQLESE
jgi:hypothetical protein